MMMNPTTPYVPGTYAKKRPEAGKVAAWLQEFSSQALDAVAHRHRTIRV